MKIKVLALLMIASLFLSAAGCSKHENEEDVPEAVIVQFDADHQNADDVYWEPAEKGFQAKFDDDGIEKVAFYSKEAKPLRVEYVVEEEEVPVVVVTNLKKRYPKVEIEHIMYVEKPNRKPYYVVRTRDPKAVSSIEINFKGIIIRRKVLENLVVVKNVRRGNGHDHDDHDDCDDHHKHKKHKHKGKGHGHGHGHGNCKHDHDHDDDRKPAIVIKL